jgi:hypothetical protein
MPAKGRPAKKASNPPEKLSQDSLTDRLGGLAVDEDEIQPAPISRQVSKASTSSWKSSKSSKSDVSKKSDASKKSKKSNPEMVEYSVTGYIAKDPKTKKKMAMKETIFIYKKGSKFNKKITQEEAVENKMKSIKKQYAKIKLHRFNTSAMFPKDVAPNIVGGLSYHFVGISLKKMEKSIPDSESPWTSDAE